MKKNGGFSSGRNVMSGFAAFSITETCYYILYYYSLANNFGSARYLLPKGIERAERISRLRRRNVDSEIRNVKLKLVLGKRLSCSLDEKERLKEKRQKKSVAAEDELLFTD